MHFFPKYHGESQYVLIYFLYVLKLTHEQRPKPLEEDVFQGHRFISALHRSEKGLVLT